MLRDDLAVWEKTNVTAFLVGGIAGTVDVPAEELELVGIALRGERKVVDKVVDRLRLHP